MSINALSPYPTKEWKCQIGGRKYRGIKLHHFRAVIIVRGRTICACMPEHPGHKNMLRHQNRNKDNVPKDLGAPIGRGKIRMRH